MLNKFNHNIVSNSLRGHLKINKTKFNKIIKTDFSKFNCGSFPKPYISRMVRNFNVRDVSGNSIMIQLIETIYNVLFDNNFKTLHIDRISSFIIK